MDSSTYLSTYDIPTQIARRPHIWRGIHFSCCAFHTRKVTQDGCSNGARPSQLFCSIIRCVVGCCMMKCSQLCTQSELLKGLPCRDKSNFSKVSSSARKVSPADVTCCCGVPAELGRGACLQNWGGGACLQNWGEGGSAGQRRCACRGGAGFPDCIVPSSVVCQVSPVHWLKCV